MKIVDILLQVLFVQLTIMLGVATVYVFFYTQTGRVTRTCGTHRYSQSSIFDAVVGLRFPAARKYRSLSVLRQCMLLMQLVCFLVSCWAGLNNILWLLGISKREGF